MTFPYVPPRQHHPTHHRSYPQHNLRRLGVAAEVLYSFLPGGPGGRAGADQDQVPEKTACHSHPEEAAQSHISHAGGDGDKASDNGDEAAEKYRVISSAVKPVCGFLNICLFQMEDPAESAGKEGIQSGRGKKTACLVKDQGAPYAAYSGRENSPRDVHFRIGGHKTPKGEDDL